MDNIPEKDSQGESIEIPKEWKFKERTIKGLHVDQIDKKERFLSATFPKPESASGEYTERVDYFFDRNGEPLDSRKESNLSEIDITLSSDIVTFLKVDSPGVPSPSLLVNIVFPNATEEEQQRIIHLDFRPGLKNASLGKTFVKDKDGNVLFNVTPAIRRDDEKEGLESGDWHINEFSVINSNFRMNGPNVAIFQDGLGNDVLRLRWEVIDGRLTLTEEHLSSGAKGSVSSPVHLETRNIMEAVLSKPPYKKVPIEGTGEEALEVPWRDLGRIIGIKTTFNDPNRKPKK